jgi:dihydroxyacetone kinase
MTRLFNAPDAFPTELLEGFVAAYPDYVIGVPGGVVRSTRYDEVAVLAGGGSGHYPAFCGLVGEGLAHGAVVGNLFSSPSAAQAHSVARAADRGKGVIFSFGNYAGDVLHFGEAVERLEADGIAARVLIVTDDIASAPAHEMHKRRGIAGDLVVFKIAGAAAREGHDLDAVCAIGERANARTRTLGVAFGGCTLPGAGAPLFTVPDGMMSVGLGIHGEPGIDEVPIPTANGLAELLVERLLADVPDDRGDRAAVILNGLGTVKYEELFVVYRRVAQLLDDAGIHVVSPDVGELCTSLDMSGVSLTLFWLDDELERLWTSPSDTPAYRKGSARPGVPLSDEERGRIRATGGAAPVDRAPATAASRTAAAAVVEIVDLVAAEMHDAADELGRIDAIAGDGDHGIGMERGTRAAAEAAHRALDDGAGAGTVLQAAGSAWSDIAGGTSGALWGGALAAIGRAIGDEHAPTAETWAAALRSGADSILTRGGATVGDKTMVDALVPFIDAVGDALTPSTLRAASRRATEAATATASLTPRLGRARPLAAKSVGTPDAGATSLARIIDAVTSRLTAGPDSWRNLT